ncbi:hypothetical protein DICVIV_13440 [Dictyocaulus viviparus]|uniref:Ig-like domain-containing protein n=1 Tax=Dictyocaulus viviparus TaxID=29172 RepID=A0A0D8X7R3_DICVI|nr:hypothetical protein DICVIV_13440 [Dictyocaulus viviparus]
MITWYWNGDVMHSNWQGWSLREEGGDKKIVSVATRTTVHESGRAVCVATNDGSSATATIECFEYIPADYC